MNAPPTLDLLATKVRGLESRLAMLEDAIQVYGPPKENPIFVIRPPRPPNLSRNQTTMMVYAFLLAGIGLYTWAKLRAGETIG